MKLLHAVLLIGGLLLAGPALAQHMHGKSGAQHERFDDPQKWAKSFDDPERAAWQKPDEVIAALALKPDARVADIGAGTGYFSIRLARTVPAGIVYAVDLEPNMVAYVADRAKAMGLANVRAVVGSPTSANLPEPVDLVLLVNVFHHIEGRTAYFRKLAASLKPGGRIAIVDQNASAPNGPPKSMRVDAATIDAEMKKSGFTRIARHTFLPYQSFLVYEATTK